MKSELAKPLEVAKQGKAVKVEEAKERERERVERRVEYWQWQSRVGKRNPSAKGCAAALLEEQTETNCFVTQSRAEHKGRRHKGTNPGQVSWALILTRSGQGRR